MAATRAEVTVTGWLNNVKSFDWGNVFTLNVEHRRQNERGEWETVDRTQFDVTTDSAVPEAKQLLVTGRINGTNTYTKKDGTTGVSIKMRASSLEVVEQTEAPF